MEEIKNPFEKVLGEFAEWLGYNEYEYAFHNLYTKTSETNLDVYYTVEELVKKFLNES